MPLTPEQRRILGPLLEAYELEREPASFSAWIESNQLQRALAHLLATDGNASHLLRCNDDGVLRVDLSTCRAKPLSAPGWGALRTVAPWLASIPTGSDSGEVATGTISTVDFGAAGTRLVMASCGSATLTLYDSTSSGSCTNPLAIISYVSSPVIVRAWSRYFDMHATGDTSSYVVQWWA